MTTAATPVAVLIGGIQPRQPNNLGLVLNTATFGQSTSALTPRVYQAGLKLHF
ncbi:MAG TPA: hypothetical protein VNY05_03300 [Candidatus Acidoferrales bacterium]|nr:hypothetical protein [Candidatus Acidoferrales bacterium]